MPDPTRFAIIDETGNITNVIVADTLEIAKEVSPGMVVVPDPDMRAGPDGTWNGKKFILPPMPSAAEDM